MSKFMDNSNPEVSDTHDSIVNESYQRGARTSGEEHLRSTNDTYDATEDECYGYRGQE
jgi:hypothetical protein